VPIKSTIERNGEISTTKPLDGTKETIGENYLKADKYSASLRLRVS